VIGSQVPQGALTIGDLRVELIDQMHRGASVPGPRLREGPADEQLPPVGAEQVRHAARVAEGQQSDVDPVLQRGAVADVRWG
jgi:hypothetical protein